MKGNILKDERIQKIMAESGLCSRRSAEAIITEGRVRVNGRPVKLGDKMNPSKDLLSVDGENVLIASKDEHLYIMLYKPRGYVTTVKDELGRKTVMELVSNVTRRVYPVGRLDKDSEGLLFFTSDGNFANTLMHPSNEISKRYRVTVRPRITEEQAASLAGGVVLDDGDKTLPATVRVIETEGKETPIQISGENADAGKGQIMQKEGRSVIEITIKEGKNRQVRRMCEAVGLHVVRLKRSAEGPVKLGMLKPGTWRNLTDAEINAIKNSAAKAKRKRRG